ncbi:hypothetical protein BU26DRAFT_175317 [Trematosphaeria pertusa]|uniref:Galactose oxidase n=1 Tax=Trematosphaeria pertusa TaxID=390896 RepID=A0A6A6HV66_9PLEO|nr:uncharacterized protein BU26DRAFT_175317 [Trematosphaeria pertusa]KAF2241652.1 hypothetical protein BU26DRAFT_175317 [Trematosphaeria pertusa]
MEAAAGVAYAAENLLSGAAALIKGVTHPALPLKAHLTHITSCPLPRAQHTLSVVKGRAYIFGGESEPGKLADNAMHIVILPSSGVLEADYTSIAARPEQPDGEVPAPRKGHTSVVIGDSVYIFGGEGVENENGRVWIFHTVRNSWTYLDPAPDTLYPSHCAGHACASSEFPGPKDITYKERAPQQPVDPAKNVPEPADPDSWGTLFVVGGKNLQTGELMSESLAFDVRSRTWSNIPTPPGLPCEGSSMALVGNILYRFGGKAGEGEIAGADPIRYLDVSPVWKHAEGGTTPLTSGWAWDEISSSADSSARQVRSHAGLEGVTTGQGRHYLLLVGGEGENSTYYDDIWALQLHPKKASAAATKDSMRSRMKRDTHEEEWAEVGYKYVDAKDDEDREVGLPEKGLGKRSRFAVAKGTEVDGASVVVWGGVDAEGKVLRDGWLVTVEW